MALLRQINKLTTRVNEHIMFVFYVILILACFAQICTRIAGIPLSWSEELARYLAVWLTFIGAAYALRKGSLAIVEILFNKLSGTSKKILIVFISICILSLKGFIHKTSPLKAGFFLVPIGTEYF